ncbi:MAG: hypothetical protein IJN16_01215, partial [Lachnospiraceae bacterium]|nr:hypothetical protein [Lachnospiraceae bacterium]
MEGYKPGAECSQCKGRCCKERGCSLSPQDMWQALGKDAGQFDLKQAEEKSRLRSELLQLLEQPEGLYA